MCNNMARTTFFLFKTVYVFLYQTTFLAYNDRIIWIQVLSVLSFLLRMNFRLHRWVEGRGRRGWNVSGLLPLVAPPGHTTHTWSRHTHTHTRADIHTAILAQAPSQLLTKSKRRRPQPPICDMCIHSGASVSAPTAVSLAANVWRVTYWHTSCPDRKCIPLVHLSKSACHAVM